MEPLSSGQSPGATGVRPSVVCRGLLEALEAAEGRRRSRKRDQTPDAIGLAVKRTLLERAIADDPDPEQFEGWLLAACLRPPAGHAVGSLRVMALQILEEWRLARTAPDFTAWLERGAPSDDRNGHDSPDIAR